MYITKKNYFLIQHNHFSDFKFFFDKIKKFEKLKIYLK